MCEKSWIRVYSTSKWTKDTPPRHKRLTNYCDSDMAYMDVDRNGISICNQPSAVNSSSTFDIKCHGDGYQLDTLDTCTNGASHALGLDQQTR